MTYLMDGAPLVRAPRLRIVIGGVPVNGAIEANVTQNNWYQADRFTATLALYADPLFSADYWSSQQPVLVDVQVSLEPPDRPEDWISLIQGEIDNVRIDYSAGALSIDGRDLTSRLIDAKTQETFANKTFSEIVTILAGRHGMTADVTPTTTLSGRYYEQDHDTISLGQFSRTTTEWDLLCTLARDEGFDLYVTGTVLHAHPSTVLTQSDPTTFNTVPPPGADVRNAFWVPSDGAQPTVANIMGLSAARALTLAKDVEVQVKSWGSKAGRGFTKTAKATGGKKIGSKDPPQIYVFIRPNLTEDAAQKLANSLLADITKHERTISFSIPGDLSVTPRSIIRLDGTGTDFDQFYYVDTITTAISGSSFSQSLSCKNHSTGSELTLK